jgi:hypothetical protein
MIRISGLKKKSRTGPKPGSKRRILVSPMCAVVAITFISTSLSFGKGFSTSIIFKASGGPYFVHMIAFKRNPYTFYTTFFKTPPNGLWLSLSRLLVGKPMIVFFHDLLHLSLIQLVQLHRTQTSSARKEVWSATDP